MENTKLKNEIAPILEKGRWYKAVFKVVNPSGTTYNWALDEDESDPIYVTNAITPNSIQISNGSSNYMTITNRLGTGRTLNIRKIERFVYSVETSLYTISCTLSASAPYAYCFSNGQGGNLYIGLSTSSDHFSKNVKMCLLMFIE